MLSSQGRDGYAFLVKKLLTPVVLLTLLLGPLPTFARVWDSPVARPTSRSIRAAARVVTVQNSDRITIRDVPLDRTFENAGFGVKIQYPSSWERHDLLQRTEPLTLVTMFLSREQRPRGIRQNINLVVEDLPTEMTLAAYTELGIRMEQDYFDTYELLQSDDILLAGTYRAHRVLFTGSLNGGEMTFQQVWMVRGKKAYVWTFADSTEAFDDHVVTFEKMMDTITMQ